MGIFLSSGVLAALLAQAPAPDSQRAGLWARVASDSTDARAWLDIGRAYLQLAAGYHAHRADPSPDTSWARAVLDTAEQALAQAGRWSPPPSAGSRTADSARVFRVYAWGEKAFLAWETAGADVATAVWHSLPEDLRLPPVLEELGENLLRACPRQGVLLTAGDADTQAAWYMRFARGLRPDLLILPLARWRGDAVFRRQVGGSLRAFVERRAVCASMGFEGAPAVQPRPRWATRPLVWVAGPETKGDRVPPQDFVFAALRLALDERETWSAPALAIYRRAAEVTPALCRPLGTFGISDEVGCR